MSSKSQKQKFTRDSRGGGGFIAIPHAVIRSEQFAALTPFAAKLLLDFMSQYRGNNNGDLCAAWSLMRKRGWKSKWTLSKYLKELLANNWIEISRQGGRNIPTLYALTFFAVSDCGGKHSLKPTQYPKASWYKPPHVVSNSKSLATAAGATN